MEGGETVTDKVEKDEPVDLSCEEFFSPSFLLWFVIGGRYLRLFASKGRKLLQGNK